MDNNEIKFCCSRPFTAVEIDDKGDVYTCCPVFINFYRIGNIFESKIEDIWYSKEATELRKKILKGDYSICNKEICRSCTIVEKESPKLSLKPDFPVQISLAYDRECNLQCITCRDNKYKNSKFLYKKYNDIIDKTLIPFAKNAKIIQLNGTGEALYSAHSRFLIKRLADENKNLKFGINTNGILFNKKNLELLGINGRVKYVYVSLPALNPKIYNQIMIGGDLNTVVKNIKWMAEEHKKRIEQVTINFVTSNLNYTEIPKLINFAKKLDIYIDVFPFINWHTKFGENGEWNIWEKSNKNYENFVKILRSSPSYDKLQLPALFNDIKNGNV